MKTNGRDKGNVEKEEELKRKRNRQEGKLKVDRKEGNVKVDGRMKARVDCEPVPGASR